MMTTKLVRVFLALLVLLSATTFAPPAQALPKDDIYTEYYDCNVALVGWRWLMCSGAIIYDGQQGGYYKRVENTSCDGYGHTVCWYNCYGGSCTLMSTPPTPPPPGWYYC